MKICGIGFIIFTFFETLLISFDSQNFYLVENYSFYKRNQWENGPLVSLHNPLVFFYRNVSKTSIGEIPIFFILFRFIKNYSPNVRVNLHDYIKNGFQTL